MCIILVLNHGATIDLIAEYETQQANGGRGSVGTMLAKKKIALEKALKSTASGRRQLAGAAPTIATTDPAVDSLGNPLIDIGSLKVKPEDLGSKKKLAAAIDELIRGEDITMVELGEFV